MIFAIAAMALAAAPAPSDPQDPVQVMAALQTMYEQSCQERAYGSYDDICSGLRKQMREAEKAEKKRLAAQRSKAATDAKAPKAPALAEAATKPGS